MSIHKKNIIIFSLLDIAYLILGTNVMLSYYFLETAKWYNYIPFVVILGLGISGLLIYRKHMETLIPIKKWEYLLTRVLTFAFLIVYIAQMIIIPNPRDYQPLLSILLGSFLVAIGLAALILHLYLLVRSKKA